MWEPRRLTALWASTVCYRDSFTFTLYWSLLLDDGTDRQTGIIIIIYLNCKWVFTRWQCTTIRHNTQITHHTQTKHSTQNYTQWMQCKYNYNYNKYNYNYNKYNNMFGSVMGFVLNSESNNSRNYVGLLSAKEEKARHEIWVVSMLKFSTSLKEQLKTKVNQSCPPLASHSRH
jgi:hypothetical protein